MRLSSAWVKIHQIPHVNCEMTSHSSSNFALFFIFMTHNSSANFKVIPFLLWTKGSHQCPNFDINDTFKCSGENFPNFSNLFSNQKSFFLQNLHISSRSWKVTPLYLCSSNNINLGHKEPIKTQICYTLERLGQNLWISLCQF